MVAYKTRAIRTRSRTGTLSNSSVLRSACQAHRARGSRLPVAGDELRAMAKVDPAVQAHLDWLGFVQPTGLVVSAHALVRAGAILEGRDADGQRLLRECIQERALDPKAGPVPLLPDFAVFARAVL